MARRSVSVPSRARPRGRKAKSGKSSPRHTRVDRRAQAPDWPARFEPEQVSSAALAPYLLPLLVEPRADRPYLSALKDRLIDLTVRMARRHTQWYARMLPEPTEPVGCKSLHRLPMVTRRQLTEHRQEFVAGITTFGFTTFTGGTTGQTPLMIERALEEQRYLVNLLSSVQTPPQGLRALGLVAANSSHGEVFQIPGSGYAFSVNFEQDAGFRKAAWLLQQDFTFPGFQRKISFIQGYFEFVHLLMLYLKEQGIRLPNQIRGVACYGMAIPPSRRAAVSDYFGVEVSDNFSMGEAHGSAPFDPLDGTYAFSPFLHAEVVDLETQEPVEHGSGELVLTTLFPFTQRFPLIRYRSGDLVFTPSRVPLGPLFRVRGRLVKAVSLGGRHVLSSGDVALALEELSYVARNRGLTSMVANADAAAGPNFRLSATTAVGALIEVTMAHGANLSADVAERDIRMSLAKVLPADIAALLRDRPNLIEVRLQTQADQLFRSVTSRPPASLRA
jgi:hypothetical protein